MMKYLLLTFLLFSFQLGVAQMDTINTNSAKLRLPADHKIRNFYAVYFTDSLGNPTKTPDLWDRELKIEKGADGKSVLHFTWRAYRHDSLALEANGICQLPSLKPIEYITFNRLRQKRSVRYQDNKVMVEGKSRKTQRDTTYSVTINIPAFVFPMDLEIFTLLPLKKKGQQFAIPFYEPASPTASYYKCEVLGKEDLKVAEDTVIPCWLLKLNYSEKAHALFWISISTQELLKVKQPTNTGYRYKIRLF